MLKHFSLGGALIAGGISILFRQLHLSYLAGVGAFMVILGMMLIYIEVNDN